MQLDLPTPAAYRGAQRWQRKLEWCRDVVNVLGHKFVAGELDVAPSHLTDALLERERKYVKAEWIEKLFELCADGHPELQAVYFGISMQGTQFNVQPVPPRLSDAELRKAYESGELQWRGGR